MNVLLDTNVLSEPMRRQPDATAMAELADGGHRLQTASVVIHALRYGVQRLPQEPRIKPLRRGPGALHAQLHLFGGLLDVLLGPPAPWRRASPKPRNGLLRAGLLHLWFLTLHPYEDGNGPRG